ncbi:MAG TPA: M48 family peptidase [Rhodospirillales bacterium]|nr:M48 family peptidase [Rhodospirillales bacterium]
MVLRVERDGGGVVITLPAGVNEKNGREFAETKTGWISARLAALAPAVPFEDGAIVPFLGLDHRIVFTSGRGRPVFREAGEIRVCGRPEHLPRRLTEWLRRQAKEALAPLCAVKAELLGGALGRISVRDTRSRWGSCSAAGNLSFSWRLVMAPEHVLDYVAAHEVAHLKFMNHGDGFWTAVAGLTADPEAARAWLKGHGAGLHRYG